MSKEAALYQSLAACGAAIVAFIGVCHEAVDEALFPAIAQVTHGQFHMFALAIAATGAMTAYCHRRAMSLQIGSSPAPDARRSPHRGGTKSLNCHPG